MKLTPISFAIHTFLMGATVIHSAQAQQSADQSDSYDLGETVVWGTAVTSNSLFVEDFAIKQADHLSDLLRAEPGVDVGGSHSMNQGINIRGVSELDLDITIDGASQTNNVFHHVGNLLINPDILQAVDLNIGNNSILNSGIGGGIAFETKDALDLLEDDQLVGARVYGGYATNNYFNYSATAYAKLTDKLDFLAYYSAIDKSNTEDADGVEQLGRKGRTDNYLVKFGLTASEDNRIELSYDRYLDKGDYSIKSNMGAGTAHHDNNIRPIEYSRESITLNQELYLGSTDVRSTLYRNVMNYKNTNPSNNEVGEGNVEVYGVKTVAETPLELANMSHTLRYGAEAKAEESKKLTNGTVTNTVSGVEKANSFAFYLENEIALSPAFSLVPGVRYNHYKPTMLASNEVFSDTLFALEARYNLTSDLRVRAAATELFKGPALSGSYLTSNSGYNPNLQAETGVNYEAAIAYQTANLLGVDFFDASLTLFQTRIDNYIDDVMTGKVKPGQLYSNSGDVEINGFEAVISASHGNLNGRLSYSRSDSRFTHINQGSAFVLGQAVDDEVGDSIAFTLGYQLPQLNASLNWSSQWVLDLEQDVAADEFKQGYDLHDINVRWSPWANLDITASVENLFNEKYGSHASHALGTVDYEPGRNFKLSAAYRF